MNQKHIQPLEWEGNTLAQAITENPASLVYEGIANLGFDLAACIDKGVGAWWDNFYFQHSSYPAISKALSLCPTNDELTPLTAYPHGITEAASAIYYGLNSAKQHSNCDDKGIADAIRRYAFPRPGVLMDFLPAKDGISKPVVSDGLIYALIGAIEAKQAMDSLTAWIDEARRDLTCQLRLDSRHHQMMLCEFAHTDHRRFTEWAAPHLQAYGRDEAEERDHAARCLGTARQMLMLADVADVISNEKKVGLENEILKHDLFKHELTAKNRRTQNIKNLKQAPDEVAARHDKIVSAAKKMINDGEDERKIASILAERFGGTTHGHRKILKRKGLR